MTGLVADIGGTNTRVALAEGPRVAADSMMRFHNADHDGPSDILAAYLARHGAPRITQACVALAGPVRDGSGRLTNRGWIINEQGIAKVTGATQVKLLNDLQAQGHALDHLARAGLIEVLDGPELPRATRLVIGLGTGVNTSVVHRHGRGLLVTAAEAGHASLPASDEDDLSLARFAAGADGFASIEDLLSGRGIEKIHAWVTGRAGMPRQMTAGDILAAGNDDADDPAVTETLRIYTRLLGRIAGDLALHHLPFGGIFLVGGVARAMTPHLARLGLAAHFRAKGRFSPLMREFAIRTVVDDYAALSGCAGYLARPA
ncbi:glucokinase [Rhodovulum bhavnagarense]|uniref:Glucokinase n=1 Tax=Rhodovulum bhavnagarense TaxID=992286 RepID=A0A4R2R957_9RHOB|nr:glucokinase [Rhodovulum bhavnagarense]TCP59752.1 glucokinase [Rhodovulum bhavnagarense]